MTRRMVCDDRTAGLGWSGVLQDYQIAGLQEVQEMREKVLQGDQIAGVICCGLKLRSGIGKH